MAKLFSLDKSLFQYQGFWQLWVSGLLIVVGFQSFSIALAVTILDAGGSASTLGLILGARVFASVLLVLAGGVWADRFPRKYVMIFADTFRAILVIGILFVSVAHLATWVLGLIVFIMGAGDALGVPASGAILTSILPEEKLAAGNAMRIVTSRTGSIVGPSIGGIFVATLGTHQTFILVAALFVIGTSLLLGIKNDVGTQKADRTPFMREIKEGLSAVRQIPWVAWLIGLASLQLMFVLGVEIVLLPVITRREFHTNSVFAACAAVSSLGAVITAIYYSRRKARRPGLVSIISWMFLAIAPLSLAFPFSKYFVIASYFIMGLANEPFGIYWSSALQREIPPELQGRVFSVDHMGTLALLPLGMAMAGTVVRIFGERNYLVFASIFHVALSFVMLGIPGAIYFSSRGPAPANSPISEQQNQDSTTQE